MSGEHDSWKFPGYGVFQELKTVYSHDIKDYNIIGVAQEVLEGSIIVSRFVNQTHVQFFLHGFKDIRLIIYNQYNFVF
jgi:hypothetical protein